jgi:hypothetical protein
MKSRPLSLVAAAGAFVLAVAQSAVADECKTLPKERPSAALRDALLSAARPEEKLSSRLLTPSLPEVTLLGTSVGTHSVVAISRMDTSGPKAFATMARQGGSSDGAALEIYWYDGLQDGTVESLGARASALENLYALVLREPPTSSFTIRGMMEGTEARPATQGQVLVELRRLRECIVSQLASLHPGLNVRRWRMASLRQTAESASAAGANRFVAVGITDEGIPLAGATVIFSRGPHLLCTAKADTAGIARCELYDSHAGNDDDEENSATVATFTGSVANDVVHPPTTFLFRERP